MSKKKWKMLSYLDLKIFFQHLRLGKEHLKKYLSKEQYEHMLSDAALTDEQKKAIHMDQIESSSTFLMVVNMIFTSIVGTCLGAAAFLDFGIDSLNAFLVLITVSATLGFLLGVFNYGAHKQRVKSIAEQQKIQNIQLQLLKVMLDKKTSKENEMIHFLDHIAIDFFSQNKKVFNYKTSEELMDWVDSFFHVYKNKAKKILNKPIQHVFIQELTEKNVEIKQWLTKNSILDKPQELQKDEIDDDYLKTVTNCPQPVSAKSLQQHNWLRNNVSGLLVGFIPTFLSGFSSMFTYFDGIPNVLKNIGLDSLALITRNPSAKLVEVLIGMGITAYFCYGFIDYNYKNYERDAALEETEKSIQKKEADLSVISIKVNILSRIKKHVIATADFFAKLELISNEADTDSDVDISSSKVERLV